MKKVYIAAPYRVPYGVSFGIPAEPSILHVELGSPEPVFDDLSAVLDKFGYDNIGLEAVLLPVKEFFTFEAEMNRTGVIEQDQGVLTSGVRGYRMNGARILLDPTRDSGLPVPLVAQGSAIEYLALRKGMYDKEAK